MLMENHDQIREILPDRPPPADDVIAEMAKERLNRFIAASRPEERLDAAQELLAIHQLYVMWVMKAGWPVAPALRRLDAVATLVEAQRSEPGSASASSVVPPAEAEELIREVEELAVSLESQRRSFGIPELVTSERDVTSIESFAIYGEATSRDLLHESLQSKSDGENLHRGLVASPEPPLGDGKTR